MEIFVCTEQFATHADADETQKKSTEVFTPGLLETQCFQILTKRKLKTFHKRVETPLPSKRFSHNAWLSGMFVRMLPSLSGNVFSFLRKLNPIKHFY